MNTSLRESRVLPDGENQKEGDETENELDKAEHPYTKTYQYEFLPEPIWRKK